MDWTTDLNADVFTCVSCSVSDSISSGNYHQANISYEQRMMWLTT